MSIPSVAMNRVWINRLRRGWPAIALLACGFALVCCNSAPTGGQARSDQQPESAVVGSANADDVELVDMKLSSPDGGKSYHVAGQLKNKSQTTGLSEVQVKVVLEDCVESGCEEIAHDVATIRTNVPPGQARPFELDPRLATPQALKGTLSWHYSVVSAQSGPPNPA